MNSNKQIVIVGGGLSGLCLAYFLSKQTIKTTLLEASSRPGGRIQTQMGMLKTPLELGATWFSELHSQLLALIEELGLEKYAQFSEGKSLFQTKSFEPPQEFFVPGSEEPSYRLKGGTEALITALANKLPEGTVHLNTKVTAIKHLEDHLEIQTQNDGSYIANQAILCLPPQLMGSSIDFEPELPYELQRLLPTVQTWMAGSIKFTLEYERPFWREKGYSGMLFSHVGIVTEMYDHTNYEGDKFGFTGFLNSGAASYSKEERQQYVLKQLQQLLGPEAAAPISYYDKVWTDDLILGNNNLVPRPHFNNGHSLLQESYMGNKLYFAGTETSDQYPGYMEGAILSIKNVLERLKF